MTEVVALAGIAVVAAVVLVVIPWCVITERRSRPCTECRRRAVESVTPTPIASPVEVRPGEWEFPASSPVSSGGPGGWRRDDRGDANEGFTAVILGLLALGFVAALITGKSASAILEDSTDWVLDTADKVGESEFSWGGDDKRQPGKAGRGSGGGNLREALNRATVEEHSSGDDYEREAFGADWTEDPSGCDTRQRVLARDLTEVEYTDTSRCEVASGDLDDPYTGSGIAFRRDDAYAVQIDHVVPLGYAWRAGAASWSKERRVAFANDRKNLLAVDGPANASKSDAGPGKWMPTNGAYGCAYLGRFLGVVNRYDLSITRADAAVVREWAPRCARGNGGNAKR